LKNHGKEPHNFQTVKCCERKFEEIEKDFQNQITQLNEDFGMVEDFTKFVVLNNRHDIERKFRDNGKNNNSVIGTVNTCVDSMEFIVGGGLHNEIGLVNDCLDNLYKGLKRQKLDTVCDTIKKFLDAPKSEGGVGCSPGQHHGGQYNGKQPKLILTFMR
jgi:hypothetical protein